MDLIDKESGKIYPNVAPGVCRAKHKANPNKWAYREEVSKEEAEKELIKEEPKAEAPKPKRKRRSKAEIEADKLKETKNK